MKKLYGSGVYVQSAGVENDLEIDGFAIAVCQEIDVELSRHRARSFDEMDKLGDDLSSFDLIVALSPASQRRALDLTRLFHLEVEYWPILDPTGLAETRDTQLRSYRQTRDQIMERLKRLDKIAYVRYASVYKDFRDLAELAREINALEEG